jgi:thymidine phosphorylase
VPSVPLIASSVMSKKIAAGADAIVLDVKFGRGAFMSDPDEATFLASEMVQLGEGAGRRTVALVTAMDNPLGRAVGNALEVREALDALAGEGDGELTDVCVNVAVEMCRLAGVTADPARALSDGSARERFEAMLRAQGGRLADGLPVAPAQVELKAPAAGYVLAIDALEVGLACVELGVGRRRKEDTVDPAAGLVIEAAVGDQVRAGQTLAVVHARSEQLAAAVIPKLEQAWKLSEAPAARPAHILARVDANTISVQRG